MDYFYLNLSCFHCFFLRFYLFFRERGRKGKRVRNINVWLPLTCPLLGTSPSNQECALTGNRTSDPLVLRPALNLLGHTSQGSLLCTKKGREREKHWCKREASIGCLQYACPNCILHTWTRSHTCPDKGPNLHPRNVPWPGIKPANFLILGQCSNQMSHTGLGNNLFLLEKLCWCNILTLCEIQI